MTKSNFTEIWFSGVLKWVTVHNQTDKYLEVISPPRGGMVKHARVFQIALKKYRKIFPPSEGMKKSGEERDFFIG